jgi:hypothetical protein
VAQLRPLWDLVLGAICFDPLDAGVRTRIRGFIKELLETELGAALGRDRYQRPRPGETGVGGSPVVGLAIGTVIASASLWEPSGR